MPARLLLLPLLLSLAAPVSALTVYKHVDANGVVTYSDKARTGDHICYYSDLAKMRRDYPNWKISWPLDDLLEAMVKSETSREPAPAV